MRLANQVRPHTFDEVVGQKAIVDNIRQQSIRKKFFQAYTLCGQFGSGKTTIARIIQLAVNCQHVDDRGNPCLQCECCKSILAGASGDIVEIDAASNTGVDNIRALKEEVNYLPSFLTKKVYIIDEVQRLSSGAFDALLKILEEPPEEVIFVLCTTERNKIPKTILSRTAVYNFGCISSEDIVTHLVNVCGRYDITFEREALALIARNSQGAMRNALSMLEQISNAGNVTVQAVSGMLGIADSGKVASLLSTMLAADEKEAVSAVMELLDGGVEPFSMISDMLEMLSDCVVFSFGGVVSGTQEYKNSVQALVEKYATGQFNQLVPKLLSLGNKYRALPDRSTLICGVIALLHESDLQNRLQAMEKNIADLKEAVIQVAYDQRDVKARYVAEETEVKPVADQQDNQQDKKDTEELTREVPVQKVEEAEENNPNYPFPVGSVVILDDRKFRVTEYRVQKFQHGERTDVIMDDLTALEKGLPVSRSELLSVFSVKAKAYTAEEPDKSFEKNMASEDVYVPQKKNEEEREESSSVPEKGLDKDPLEEVPKSSIKKQKNGEVDLFAMFGIGTGDSMKKEPDVQSLETEMEKSAVLKAVIDFSCDVDVENGEVNCREKKEEPMGRILNAFAEAGKVPGVVKYA